MPIETMRIPFSVVYGMLCRREVRRRVDNAFPYGANCPKYE